MRPGFGEFCRLTKGMQANLGFLKTKATVSDEALTALQEAVSGLLYMSESDEPFELVHGTPGSATLERREVLDLLGRPPGTPVHEVPLGSFFKDLTEEKSWHGEAEKADVRRYRKLLEVLNQHLSDVKVFRAGEIQVDILIVGRTREGEWTGAKTKAVET
jgi:hypothetical protein